MFLSGIGIKLMNISKSKPTYFLQKIINFIFICFGIVALLFNILAPTDIEQSRINSIILVGLIIFFIFLFKDSPIARLLQIVALIPNGIAAIIFTTELNYIGDGVLILSILLLYSYQFIKNFLFRHAFIYAALLGLIHGIALLLNPELFDFVYLISMISAVVILLATFALFNKYYSDFIIILKEYNSRFDNYISKQRKNENSLVIGQIAGNVLHNMQQESAQGLLHFIKEAVNNGDKTEALMLLDSIEDMVIQHEELRKKVLHFIWASKDNTIKKVDVKNVLSSIDAYLQYNRDKLKGIKIRVSAVSVFVDVIEVDMFLILLNIINNAIEALNKINRDDKLINVIVFTENNKAIISIDDNGKGFETTEISEIQSKKELGGLGLFLTENIIENRYKGKLILKNKDGASVRIELPIAGD